MVAQAGSGKAGHPWETRLRSDTILGESPVSSFHHGSCCCLIWAGRGGPASWTPDKCPGFPALEDLAVGVGVDRHWEVHAP